MENFNFINASDTKTLIVFSAAASSAITIAFIKYFTQVRKQQLTEEQLERLQKEQEHQNAYSGLLSLFDYNEKEGEECRVHLPGAKDDASTVASYYEPKGLPNIGNTCYMNSLLQSLAGSHVFMGYVKKLWNTVVITEVDTSSLISFRLLELLINLNKGSLDTCPRELYSLLINSDFTQYSEQQDSHELLCYLQDKLTKMTANYLRSHSLDEGLSCAELYDSSLQKCSVEEQKSDEEVKSNGVINLLSSGYIPQQTKHIRGKLRIKDLEITKKLGINPFAGVYLSTITCNNCGPEEALQRWEVAYDLSLEVRSTLTESLNQYFKGEQIEDYTCIKCSLRQFLKSFPSNTEQIGNHETREAIVFLQKLYRVHDLDEELFVKEWKDFKRRTGNTCKLQIDKLHSNIIKKFSLATPPKILCVHFKRVYYNQFGQMTLNRQFISFPEMLDLSKVQNMKTNGYQIDAQYKLSGVIQHFGSAIGGHYIAYRPLFNHQSPKKSDKWIVCDDSKITIIDKYEVFEQNAYMLLYERVGNNLPQ